MKKKLLLGFIFMMLFSFMLLSQGNKEVNAEDYTIKEFRFYGSNTSVAARDGNKSSISETRQITFVNDFGTNSSYSNTNLNNVYNYISIWDSEKYITGAASTGTKPSSFAAILASSNNGSFQVQTSGVKWEISYIGCNDDNSKDNDINLTASSANTKIMDMNGTIISTTPMKNRKTAPVMYQFKGENSSVDEYKSNIKFTNGTKILIAELILKEYHLSGSGEPSPVDAAITAIDSIGTVAYTQASLDKINAADIAIKNVPVGDITGITNMETYTNALTTFNGYKDAKLQAFKTAVGSIATPIVLGSEEALLAAETLYDEILEVHRDEVETEWNILNGYLTTLDDLEHTVVLQSQFSADDTRLRIVGTLSGFSEEYLEHLSITLKLVLDGEEENSVEYNITGVYLEITGENGVAAADDTYYVVFTILNVAGIAGATYTEAHTLNATITLTIGEHTLVASFASAREIYTTPRAQ